MDEDIFDKVKWQYAQSGLGMIQVRDVMFSFSTAASSLTAAIMALQSDPDLNSLGTPENCVADFCLIPIGTAGPSVSQEVAEVQRLMQKSNLTYSMHSAGTTVEGSWDDVMRLIGQAHYVLHRKGIVRIQTDIRVGSRTDKKQKFSEKVTAVNDILAADVKRG